MPAVMNEMHRGETTPIRMILGHLHSLANTQSLASCHETIGFKNTVENMTLDVLQGFANDFYTADRLTYVLVGDHTDT